MSCLSSSARILILCGAIGLGSCSRPVDLADQAPAPSPSPLQVPYSPPDLSGIEITVLTLDGPQIAEPMIRRAPDFEALTGGQVTINTVPFSDIYDLALQDMREGTQQFDAVVFAPQWLVDFADPGYLEVLTERVAADPAIRWEDIAPFFRDQSSTFGGEIYTIPLDGDFHIVYYRSDLLEQAALDPPRTWSQYLAIAERFQGQDLNGDGQADYGSCIAKRPNDQSYWMFGSILSGFVQSQGTQQGMFFDPETMISLARTPAFAQALDIYKQTGSFGPPDELDLNVTQTRERFVQGRCALSLDWGDIGTLSIGPNSQVEDRVGAVILPGSTQVFDRSSGQMVACDKLTCPYAIEGINHAPYAAFGGWAGAIQSTIDPAKQDAAYAFLSFMSQPQQANEDVTIGASGYNPYRISQFTQRDAWIEAGMSFEAASRYLGAIGLSLRSDNVVLDLRIPQSNRYQQTVLDDALTQFLREEITRDQAMQQIHDGWEAITDQIGRESQRAAYRSSLGLDP